MPVVLKLDRERVLKFNPSAAFRFKAAYGKALLDVMVTRHDASGGKVMPELAADPDCMRHVLWAGLLLHDPKLTLEKTLKLMDDLYDANPDAAGMLGKAIGDAMSESGMIGAPDEDEAQGGKAVTGSATS